MKDFCYGFFLTLMTLTLALPVPVHAQDDDTSQENQTEMKIVDRGTIKQVLKSDMIMLDNVKRYRLENILVPPFEDDPAIEELKKFINAPVVVYSYHDVEDDQNKHIVPYAHIVANRGLWIQQDLISKGLAWAYPTETSPQTVGVLKQAEEKARVDHLGFWKNPAYAIKSPDETADFLDSYQIVEGRVTNVTLRSNVNMVVFSFGKGKRRDFAVMFPNNARFHELFDDPVTGERNGKGMLQWKGRVVRVRGWLKDEGAGPMMELTRREQLDIVMQKED